jgi:hypothetical protein
MAYQRGKTEKLEEFGGLAIDFRLWRGFNQKDGDRWSAA